MDTAATSRSPVRWRPLVSEHLTRPSDLGHSCLPLAIPQHSSGPPGVGSALDHALRQHSLPPFRGVIVQSRHTAWLRFRSLSSCSSRAVHELDRRQRQHGLARAASLRLTLTPLSPIPSAISLSHCDHLTPKPHILHPRDAGPVPPDSRLTRGTSSAASRPRISIRVRV